MGLYLCVFKDDDELEGVEIGSYSDFHQFREAVTNALGGNIATSKCPVLLNHSDCDGVWTIEESKALLKELQLIEEVLKDMPPIELDVPWKQDVSKTFGIKPNNLLECYFDIDGELLVDRLRKLAEISIDNDVPILFQ